MKQAITSDVVPSAAAIKQINPRMPLVIVKCLEDLQVSWKKKLLPRRADQKIANSLNRQYFGFLLTYSFRNGWCLCESPRCVLFSRLLSCNWQFEGRSRLLGLKNNHQNFKNLVSERSKHTSTQAHKHHGLEQLHEAPRVIWLKETRSVLNFSPHTTG